jgi:hypothetical protein
MSGAITSATSGNTINGLIINSGALSGITGITMTSGNLDMANGLITNIGNSGTAFTSGGGLTLASTLTLSGSVSNIALGSNYLSGDGGDEGIYINSSGNVGIGTTTPNQLLSLASATSGGIEIAAPSETAIYFTDTNGDDSWKIYKTSSGSIVFKDVTEDINAITISADSGHNVSFSGDISSLEDISSSNDVLVGDNLYVSGPDSYSGNYYPCWSDSSGAGNIGRCSSDERLKGNINYLNDNLLEKVLALKPATYQNKLRGEDGEVLDGLADGIVVGFIAQDVQALFPEAVGVNESDGFLTFSPQNLVPYLVKAIQEQQGQIEALKAGSAVSLDGLNNLVLSGGLTITGEVDMGKDTVGEAVIKAGDTFVEIVFENKYNNQPVVTITKMTAGVLSDYYVSDTTVKGFRINIDPLQNNKDIYFSWHAFGSNGGVRLFSDGLEEKIEIIDSDENVEEKEEQELLREIAEDQSEDDSAINNGTPVESENPETPADTEEINEAEDPVEDEIQVDPIVEKNTSVETEESSAPEQQEAPAEEPTEPETPSKQSAESTSSESEDVSE